MRKLLTVATTLLTKVFGDAPRSGAAKPVRWRDVEGRWRWKTIDV
jgi:hypothetical protein